MRASVQPHEIIRRQHNIERSETVLQLAKRVRTDQRLGQNIGERDMDRLLSSFPASSIARSRRLKSLSEYQTRTSSSLSRLSRPRGW